MGISKIVEIVKKGSSEKGAITLYVTVACLFIMIIGITSYIGAANKQAAQIAELKKIEESYNNPSVTAEELYQHYDGGDIVPIYTPEQFAKVGSGEEVYVAETGKFYTFSVDKTYMFYGVPEDFEILLGTIKEELKDEVKIEIGTVKVGVLTLTKNPTILTNSVTITATASSENGILTYVSPDKIEKIYESGTTEIAETYEVTKNGTYTFKVVEGNGVISDAQIVITNVIENDIEMELSREDWTNEDVVVTVTWPDGSDTGLKEIKIDDGNWTRYTGGTTDIICEQNCTVYARVNNQTDDVRTNQITVENIEKNPAIIIPKIIETIECGEIKDIAEGFEIQPNGNSPYSIEYSFEGWNGSNILITNTSALPVGSNTVKCKVTKESGAISEQTTTVTVNRLSGTLSTNKTIKPSAESNVQIVIPAGFAPAILEGSNSTTSLPGENGKVKSIMPQSQWNNITVDQINKGIVVVHQKLTYDGGNVTGTVPDYDEYVWVPIPESSNFAFTDFGGGWSDDVYWDDTSTIEYTNMVESVNENKGFYISRYEASYGETPKSRRQSFQVRNISPINAITYSSDVQIVNAHLIYGIEWDSVMNWLVNSKAIIESSTAGTNKEMTLEDIQTSSCSWGNYSGSKGGAATDSGELYTTGYNEYWKANNIYELAGSLWEITQEKRNNEARRMSRGGGYSWALGDNIPAGYRSSMNENYGDYYVGFRFSFYL